MTWDQDQLAAGPLPLWWQIADRLRTAIQCGEFQPGEALPSEARLNDIFGVSRTTARAALDRLEQEGLILRRSGKGSVVLAPRVEQPLNRLSSFAEDMTQRGLAPSYETRKAEYRPVTAAAAAALGVDEGTALFHVRRLLKADGQPIGLSESWTAASILAGRRPPTEAELDAGSMYLWYEQHCGVRIAGGTEIIEAAVADHALAQELAIDAGAPTLVAKRRCHAADGALVEYVVLHYRADRYRFHIDLVRP